MQLSPRRLIAVFESPVSEMLFRFGVELGFQTVLVEPDPTRLGRDAPATRRHLRRGPGAAERRTSTPTSC